MSQENQISLNIPEADKPEIKAAVIFGIIGRYEEVYCYKSGFGIGIYQYK